MELFFALHKPKEFDYTPYCYCYAMSILSVCDIQCYSTILCFTGKEREVYRVHGYKERSFCELANERLNPFELIFCERLPPKRYGVVGLWAGLGDGDGIVLAFIHTFDQNFEMFSAAYSQDFCRRDY